MTSKFPSWIFKSLIIVLISVSLPKDTKDFMTLLLEVGSPRASTWPSLSKHSLLTLRAGSQSGDSLSCWEDQLQVPTRELGNIAGEFDMLLRQTWFGARFITWQNWSSINAIDLILSLCSYCVEYRSTCGKTGRIYTVQAMLLLQGIPGLSFSEVAPTQWTGSIRNWGRTLTSLVA